MNWRVEGGTPLEMAGLRESVSGGISQVVDECLKFGGGQWGLIAVAGCFQIGLGDRFAVRGDFLCPESQRGQEGGSFLVSDLE